MRRALVYGKIADIFEVGGARWMVFAQEHFVGDVARDGRPNYGWIRVHYAPRPRRRADLHGDVVIQNKAAATASRHSACTWRRRRLDDRGRTHRRGLPAHGPEGVLYGLVRPDTGCQIRSASIWSILTNSGRGALDELGARPTTPTSVRSGLEVTTPSWWSGVRSSRSRCPPAQALRRWPTARVWEAQPTGFCGATGIYVKDSSLG